MFVVLVSTVVFVLSTMPELTDDIDRMLFTNTTTAGEISEKEPEVVQERWEDVSC